MVGVTVSLIPASLKETWVWVVLEEPVSIELVVSTYGTSSTIDTMAWVFVTAITRGALISSRPMWSRRASRVTPMSPSRLVKVVEKFEPGVERASSTDHALSSMLPSKLWVIPNSKSSERVASKMRTSSRTWGLSRSA